MSGPFGSSQWMYNAGSDYEIPFSLRFDGADGSYLHKTPSASASTRVWTFATWIKRSTLGGGASTHFNILGISSDNDPTAGFRFQADSLAYWDYGVGGTEYALNASTLATAKFRDTNDWAHVMVAVNTTHSTDTNRLKIYWNGVLQTLDNTNQSGQGNTYPDENADTAINASEYVTWIGASNSYGSFAGYMADTYFINNQQLTPASFGETGDFGEFKPIEYTGTYDAYSSYLDYADSGNLGDDESGNGADWGEAGIVATDQMLDTPTNNFATFNRLRGLGPTMFEGNLLTETSTNTVTRSVDTNFEPQSGAWYVEVLIKVDGANSGQNATHVGVANDTFVTGNEFKGHSNGVSYCMDGQKGLDNSVSDYGATYASGDVIGIAYDTDNDNITFYKNNAAQPQLTTGFDISNGRVVVATNSSTATGQRYGVNFGQDSSFAGEKTAGGNSDANGVGDFLYAVPSGYLALCNSNLPEPTIIPSEHFNTVLYTGDGSVQDITTVGFLPDFTWIKNRDTTDFHQLFDSLRGPTELLMSDSSTLEATDDDTLTAFLSNGFTTGDDLETNTDGEAYVAWNWKAGGNAAAVGSNTDGSINTTDTSANVDAGFSIITYTGNGTAGATIGHGLSKVPEMFIVRQRDQASSWWTFHKDLDATAPEDKSIRLNLDSSLSDDATIWNDTAPTSTLISLGSYADVNRDAGLFLCYAFHSVDGYCKVGSYIGNGNADGTFVNTGFRPRFILNKALYGSTSWVMTDTSRSTFNQTIGALLADNRGAEQTYTYYDIVSNGFKARNTSSWVNGNGVTNIYIAFAEQPFKYSNAR
jgi:hypothetical protein